MHIKIYTIQNISFEYNINTVFPLSFFINNASTECMISKIVCRPFCQEQCIYDVTYVYIYIYIYIYNPGENSFPEHVCACMCLSDIRDTRMYTIIKNIFETTFFAVDLVTGSSCMYVCIHVYIYIYIYIYIYDLLCSRSCNGQTIPVVYIYIYIYTYMYTYIYISDLLCSLSCNG